MINISKLYSGLASESDYLRYSHEESLGPVVVYNCTPRCNLKCVHCYSSSDSRPHDSELTSAQADKFLADLADAKCPVVLFSGGEPLLRSDIFDLLAEAKRQGLRTVLSTNGTLIDSHTAARLAEVGLSYAGISLDGPEQFHDNFRKTTGSFQATLKGIEKCKKAGIKTGLRFTITKANALHVPTIFDIAASSGVTRICFYHLIRTGRAKDLDAQTLSPQQTRQTIETIIQKTADFARESLVDEVLTVGNHADGPFLLLRMLKENHRGYEDARNLLLANGGNKTGQNIACVTWDGAVHPDQFWLNYSLGNVKEKSFENIWQDSAEPVLNKLRNKSTFADPRCLTCRWFDLCKGNYRFLGPDPDPKSWLNEPPCYLTDQEIRNSRMEC
ncbi:MAG TPA: radical SAM protein [Sedimentisphaerales bacterium]|nr:radical SAM protein [Sedimentisphaerales bacterium]